MASFVFQVWRPDNNRRNEEKYSSHVFESVFQTGSDVRWDVGFIIHRRFMLEVEFLKLKISPLNGGEPISIWSSKDTQEHISSVSHQSMLTCLSRMLDDSIHADVTIKTIVDHGTLRAHKALLSASSPVFQSMFSHILEEKMSSTIEINDMSLESCRALLSYLYGTIKNEDVLEHRIALLDAANRYDIAELKDDCEKCLVADINSKNVLERLHEAWDYKLNMLKKRCIEYISYNGIHDIKDEMAKFLSCADRELISEIFQQMVEVPKKKLKL